MALADLPRVEARSRAEWRAWLAANHATDGSIWLVTWKKGPGAPYLPYGDIVEEALCFGWIDSRPARLDEARTMLLLSPRRPGSVWSAANRERVARLTAAGLMEPAGLRKVAAARADGSWDALAEAEAMDPPPDLAAALAAEPVAAHRFAAFPPGVRRAILQWIGTARAEATRARRVARTVADAAQGHRANHPRQPARR